MRATTPRRSGRSSPSRALVALWLTIGGLVLVACVDEAPTAGATTTAERPTEAPATTVDEGASEETPPPTDPPGLPEVGAGGGSGSRTLLIVGGLGLAAIAVFAVASNAARSRPRSAETQTPLRSQLTEVVDGARWIHDAASIEVLLATGPDETRTGWSEARRRMVGIENQIATLAIGTGDPALDENLRYLGRCLADLRGAEEAYVAAKVAGDGSARSDERLAQADETVLARRQHLQAAIEPVANALRG